MRSNMPVITSVGVGSGIDVQGLVEKLVSAEGDPATEKLDRKEAKLQSSMSALGVFQGALTEFKMSLGGLTSPEAFTNMSITVSDEDIVEASISGTPEPGSYDINVERLAQQHRLVSGTYTSDRESIGTGSLSLQFGEIDNSSGEFVINSERSVKNISITKENDSLHGIQQAINNADTGIKASVLKVGKGFRLILSSQFPGANNSIRLKVNDDDTRDTDLFGLSTLSYDPTKLINQGQNLRTTSEAINAKVQIDGVDIEVAENSIDDVINGVTVKLTADAIDKPFSIEIFHDKEKVAAAIEEFVTQYNSFIENSRALTTYDPETKEAGPLANESSVRSVLTQIRRELGSNFSNVNEKYISLTSLGINTQRSGELTIDSAKVNSAVDNEISEVSKLFSRTGFANDSFVQYLSASNKTNVGNYPVFIDAMPTQGVYSGGDVATSNIIVAPDINTFSIQVDNIESSVITLNSQIYSSLENLASELQSKINGDKNLSSNNTAVNVAVEGGHLVLTSQLYGGTSNIELLEMSDQLKAVTGLGFSQGSIGSDIKGAIGGKEAIGTGRTLTGQGEALDLQVEVIGGDLGRRGTVSYSKGVAERLDKLLMQSLEGSGLLQGKSKGLVDRLKNIAEDRNKLAEKLEKSEKQHLKTFSNLDALVGKMRSTGEYLSKQLANLPGARNQSK